MKRAVSANLPSCTEQDLHHGVRVAGKTLMETLLADRRHARDNKKRLASNYWDTIRERFQIATIGDALTITATDASVDQVLMKARDCPPESQGLDDCKRSYKLTLKGAVLQNSVCGLTV